MFCNNRTNRTEMFFFFRNLQFPANNFWGEDATPSRSSTSESSIPVPPDVPPSAGWEVRVQRRGGLDALGGKFGEIFTVFFSL